MTKAMIIYETRTGSTGQIAEAMRDSLQQNGIDVALKKSDEVDVKELADYDGIILGSPTYHKDMIGTMKTFLFKLENAGLKGKIGGAFGAYGWSGEAVEMLSETMQNIFAMDIVEPRGRLTGKPGSSCYRDYAQKIAEALKKRGKS